MSTFNTLRTYITIYHTYWLLYCKRHIQMTSNENTINVGTKESEQNEKITFNKDRMYITIYHTYWLL